MKYFLRSPIQDGLLSVASEITCMCIAYWSMFYAHCFKRGCCQLSEVKLTDSLDMTIAVN